MRRRMTGTPSPPTMGRRLLIHVLERIDMDGTVLTILIMVLIGAGLGSLGTLLGATGKSALGLACVPLLGVGASMVFC
jgi:hypothetical protein